MLSEIEEKIVEHLGQRLESAGRVTIDKAHSSTSFKLPGVDVSIGDGKFERISQQYKFKPQIFVVVTFQNLRSAADLRRGVYPIVLSILRLLIDRTFGLKIDGLKPVNLLNITTKEEADEGKMVIQLEFETSFVITTESDEQVADLLRIGLNYYLQDPTDDGVADASDLVALSTM